MSFYINDQVFVSKHLKGRSKVRKNYIPRGTNQRFPERNFFSEGKNGFPAEKKIPEKKHILRRRRKRFLEQEKRFSKK